VIHRESFADQQGVQPAIPIPGMGLRELTQAGAKPPLRGRRRHARQPLGGARLLDHGAGAALGDLERSDQVIDCCPAASRA